MQKKLSAFWLPSTADVLFVVLLGALCFFLGGRLLGDGDTGYHIRAGEYMLRHRLVLKEDIFSYHQPALSWTAHEWLSEVLMALIHKVSGLTGIVVFYSFLLAGISGLIVIQAQRASGIFYGLLIGAFAILSSAVTWLARPHIFTLLFFLVTYQALRVYQKQNDPKALYGLPLLMILWVNLHGGFIIGLMLQGIYLTGNTLSWILAPQKEKQEFSGKIKTLAMVLLGCFAAALVNPRGYELLFFPFRLTSNKFLMDHVQEFLAPNFHDILIFTYFLLFIFLLLAISKISLSIIECLLLLFFCAAALYSRRHIGLFSIVAAPVAARQLQLFMESTRHPAAVYLKGLAERMALQDRRSRGHVWPLLAVGLVAAAWCTHKIQFGFAKAPSAAIEFLKQEKIPGRVFNQDELGDYLIYAAWPQYHVFFDGRSDMYGEKILKDYLEVAAVRPGWQEVLHRYGIGWVFCEAASPLTVLLLEREDWQLIYADKAADIFVRKLPLYQPWIKKYPNAKLVPKEDP